MAPCVLTVSLPLVSIMAASTSRMLAMSSSRRRRLSCSAVRPTFAQRETSSCPVEDDELWLAGDDLPEDPAAFRKNLYCYDHQRPDEHNDQELKDGDGLVVDDPADDATEYVILNLVEWGVEENSYFPRMLI